ncbi:MAG TPA: aldehyde dehydrogenase family protein, partial [Pseudonocardiaceae bacterium]|nr:aldehyde dehydrogenase family protein [Pseudonocardiaceae bacterium]
MMTWSYAPAPESPETARLQPSYRMFVDGKFTDGGGEPLRTVNPATEEPLAEVSTASSADVDTAIRAARRAYDKVWSRIPVAERAKYLFRIARLVQERSRELAVLESLNTGMPIVQSRDVAVPAAAAHFFHYAGWADKLGYAGYGPDPRPLGVAGQLVGSRNALVLAARSIAPALAGGNTVVLSPAATTPLTALVLAEICQQADLPPGVLNVLPGTGEVGAALVKHDNLDKVAFTGGAEVGKQIQRTLAGTGRSLTLSLGGSAATVVFDDAPLDQAVDGIVSALCSTAWPGSRLLAQEPIADHLLDTLRTRLAALRVGAPLDKNTDVGAVSSAHRLQRIRALADSAEADGAQRWTSPSALPAQGFFFAPTMFSEVSQMMRIAREELLGPLLPVLTFRTPDEAVDKANSTPAGLSASIWTGKGSRLVWAAQRIRAGVVWANTVHRFDPAAPFGGYRESALGRECGPVGLAEYLD